MASTVEYNTFDFTDTDWANLGNVETWPINYLPEVPQDPNRASIAIRVLTQNSIDIDPASQALLNYGTLDGYDIHNMDAAQAIKSSLFEEIRDQRLIEVYANAEGYAEFVEIGSEEFTTAPRYRVPNRKIVNRIQQVSVAGFNPPATVYVRGPFDILTNETGEREYINDIANIMADTCYEEVFDRYATVMYRTPILSSTWGDVLDSLYNVQAFEEIIGWIHKIIIDDDLIADTAEVIFSDQTLYPVQIEQFREDIEYIRYTITPGTEQEVRCFLPPTIDFNTQGIILDVPNSTYIDESTGQELSDLLDVRQVIIMGWEVIGWYTITEGNNLRLAANCKYRRIPFNLSEGSDYAWGFDDQNNLKIIFGVAQTDYDAYIEDIGYDITTPSFIIGGPKWDYANGEGDNLEEYRMWPHLGGSTSGGAHGGFGSTMLWEELWVVVTRQKSSITIKDPEGNADDALRNSTYELYAIIKCDPPAPVAGYGEDTENDPYFDPYVGSVNHLDCVFDHDPMTVQDLTTCDMALLQEALAGQSISITAPFIDTDIQIEIYGDESTVTYADTSSSVLFDMAEFLYDLTNEDIDEYTYIFGPTELVGQQPDLGMIYGDGIINSITYSYQDSSSYLCTIVKGPRYLKDTVGLSEASIWQMQTEVVTREGVVTQVAGNGIHYAVHVEGMGDFIAVNTVANQFPPEVGDRVTIEINNVPVGWQ